MTTFLLREGAVVGVLSRCKEDEDSPRTWGAKRLLVHKPSLPELVGDVPFFNLDALEGKHFTWQMTGLIVKHVRIDEYFAVGVLGDCMFFEEVRFTELDKTKSAQG